MTIDIRHRFISIAAGLGLLGSLGLSACDKEIEDTTPPVEIAKVESEPRFEGRQIVMVLAPR